MKTLYITIIGLIGLLTVNCTEPHEPQWQHLSVAIDKTEANGTMPRVDDILKRLHHCHLSDGISLTIIPISDIRYTTRQNFLLDIGETGWLANEDTRRMLRKRLFGLFKDSLEEMTSKKQDLKRSDIFRAIINEINALASKTGKRTLLVYSDLKEHSFFSVYNKRQLKELFDSPSKVKNLFESQMEISSDLSDITIIIVHVPVFEDQLLFTQMVDLYKDVLEPRGAKVIVGQSLNIKL